MSETRDCTFEDERGDNHKATFLRWGDSYYLDEGNNPFPFTVAIVETAEGKVHELPPHKVTFVVRAPKGLLDIDL